jgi:hypothetical protein
VIPARISGIKDGPSLLFGRQSNSCSGLLTLMGRSNDATLKFNIFTLLLLMNRNSLRRFYQNSVHEGIELQVLLKNILHANIVSMLIFSHNSHKFTTWRIFVVTNFKVYGKVMSVTFMKRLPCQNLKQMNAVS